MNMFVRQQDAERPPFSHRPMVDPAVALRRALTPQSLIRHWKLIGAVIASFMVLGVAYLALRTVTYVGTTSVLITGGMNADSQRLSVTSYADFQDWNSKIRQLAADKARYHAEAEGAESITFPDELTTAGASPSLKRVLDSTSLLFDARKRAAAEQTRVLGQSLQLVQDEVVSLTKQVEYAALQQKATDEELQSVRTLADKGLASIARRSDIERTAAVLASRKIELETELLDRRQKIVEIQKEIADVDANRRTEALTKLQEIDADMRTARARLDQAKSMQAMAASSSSPDPTSVENQAEIIRSDATAQKVVAAAGLQNDMAFLYANSPASSSSPTEEQQNSEDVRRRLAVYVLQRGLTVERAGRASRLDISFVSASPDRAMAVADAYAAVYLGARPPQELIPATSDESSAEPSAPQLLKSATLKQESPPAKNVLIAMVFVGLVIGPGLAFAIELVRHLRAGA